MRYLAAWFLLGLCGLCFSGSLWPIEAAGDGLSGRFLSPSSGHPLGTDELGRDVFLRLLEGGRVSLAVGIVSALLCALIGTAVGVTAGYAGGKIDALLMRLTDMLLALPLLPLLIILAAVDLEKLGFATSSADMALYKIVAIISLFGWTGVARLTRARALSLKKMDFVTAARGLGVDDARIVLRHILPNLASTVIIATALAAGNTILTESVLSFLGLGISPPAASWGNMLTNAQDNIWDQPMLAVYPGVMIFATVLACNFLGDALQRRFDPRK